MRLSTRLGLGAALAALPLLAVIAFSLQRMQELARNNERLTERQVIGLQIGFGVILRLERLEEYRRKHLVSKDAGYAHKFEETLSATQAELERVSRAELSPGESMALSRFAEAFGAFARDKPHPPLERDPRATFTELEQLVSLAADVQRETRRGAELEAAAAVRVRERTWQAALLVAAVATALSFTLILLTVRSLRARLDQLILGTQAVSQGAFSFQLDAARDDELGQMARAFNQMVEALAQIERMKADFISSVSHELRTPLVAMLETNQFLLDELPGPLTQKQRKMLKLNTQAAQRLSNMISNLLDLSRLKAGIHYTTSDQDLAQLTQSAVSELEAVAFDRRIELSTNIEDGSVGVKCDPDRYVQVVQNLVENALKYTPAGGRVEVTLSTCSSGDLPAEAHIGDRPRSCALLSVEDSGPGIPEADRQRVFEKFFRRQELASDGGVGLGLAICREIVEAHHGSVWVGHSPRLGGAALNVALPALAAQPARRKALRSA